MGRDSEIQSDTIWWWGTVGYLISTGESFYTSGVYGDSGMRPLYTGHIARQSFFTFWKDSIPLKIILAHAVAFFYY